MTVLEVLRYKEELEENQKMIRQMVKDSLEDMKAGKGKDYNEFFDELEKRYQDV